MYVTWGGKPRASVKLLLLLHDHVESVGVGWHSIGLGEISHPGAINDNQGGHCEAARGAAPSIGDGGTPERVECGKLRNRLCESIHRTIARSDGHGPEPTGESAPSYSGQQQSIWPTLRWRLATR